MKEAFLQWCMYKGNVLVSRKIMIPIYIGYDYMASMDYMDPDVRCPPKRLLNIITHSLVKYSKPWMQCCHCLPPGSLHAIFSAATHPF